MSTADQSLPAGGPAREEIARMELERTVVSPVTARLLLVLFLTASAGVPIAEWAAIRAGRAEGIATAWSRLFALPSEIRSHRTAATGTADPGPWSHLVAANRILIAGFAEFERALEDEALIARLLRPRTQVVMTSRLGAGNERVYRGREGWLFYRPDVEYVTGPGFLDQAQLKRRVAPRLESVATPQHTLREVVAADPRPAIAQFRRDLEARGIALVVVPTPLKPGVHPEKLAWRYADTTSVLQNPSHRAFVEDLRRHGVLVFDPSEALASARLAGPQYLATDSHWRPEAMETVAELLGSFIGAQVPLPFTTDPGYQIERREVSNTGDVARMLDLPDDSSLFPVESAWLRRVLQPDGSPWRPSRDADVLMLGDSFTNIYSLESMGWGTAAGFAEQLSFTLRRPVDRLVQNDEGAFATRAMLSRDPGRLDGKRVVVYQFAVRELAFGDWKIIPLPPPQAGGSR